MSDLAGLQSPAQGKALHKLADPDLVVIGTKDGVKRTKNNDNDGDKEDEIILEDPNISPTETYGKDLDGDGDHDVIVVGTKVWEKKAP